MPEHFNHPVVLTSWSLAVAVFALFTWWTISGALRHRIERSERSLSFFLFALSCDLTAGLTALTLYPMPVELKMHCFRGLWSVGALSLAYWIRAILAFLEVRHAPLERLSKISWWIAVFWLFDMLIAALIGGSLMYSTRPSDPDAVLLVHVMGETYAHRWTVTLLSVAIAPVLFGLSAFWLLKVIRAAAVPDKLLTVGVLLTVILGTLQALLPGLGVGIAIPLICVANTLEAGRISWAQTIRLGRELEESLELQRAQRAQIEAQRELMRAREIMVQLGEGLARVSHDLRGPLSGAVGVLELLTLELEEASGDAGEMGRLIAETQRALKHALSLTERITRQARRSVDEPAQARPLKEILEDAVALCAHRLDRVRIERDLKGALEVWGRPTELTQLFINLLNNAIDAIRSSSAPWIKLEAWSKGEIVHARIQDSGWRPADEIVDRMFRARFTTRGDDQGTGLGLEICARIIEAHGGRAYVDRGEAYTTIHLELPSRPPEVSAPRAST